MPSEPISVIVPTYKEAANIPLLARRLFAALEQAGMQGELIVVDDNSRDGTDRATAELATEFPVRLITRVDARGLSSAVVRGFSAAAHDILVCMDADLSHPPESVPTLVEPVASGKAEFTLGSRYVPGGSTEETWGVFRKLNSTVATLLARPLTPVRDPMAGYFCLHKDVLHRAEAAGLDPIGYKIGLEILIKSRAKNVKEIPIHFADRIHGRSKLTLKQQYEYLRHLTRLYRFRMPAMTWIVAIGLLAGLIGVGGWIASRLMS